MKINEEELKQSSLKEQESGEKLEVIQEQSTNDSGQDLEEAVDLDAEGKESDDSSDVENEEPPVETEEQKNEKLQDELEAQKEQYLRLLAEFENFKKRSITESQKSFKICEPITCFRYH